jgi:hypothetical protein
MGATAAQLLTEYGQWDEESTRRGSSWAVLRAAASEFKVMRRQ